MDYQTVIFINSELLLALTGLVSIAFVSAVHAFVERKPLPMHRPLSDDYMSIEKAERTNARRIACMRDVRVEYIQCVRFIFNSIAMAMVALIMMQLLR